jgi:hypothetical protein
LKVFQKARDYLLRVLEEHNVLVVQANYCIAGVLVDLKKFAKALVLLKTVTAIFSSARSRKHLCVAAEGYKKMAQCMEEQRNLAGALNRAKESSRGSE